MNELDQLYGEMILDHARHPHNKGLLADADLEAAGRNPICGDEVSLQLALDGDRLTAARFRGSGCAISQASASMLTDAIAGMPLDEVGDCIERVERLLRGENAEAAGLDDLDALRGVARFPMRVKCALLAWKVLREALSSRDRP
jgi:nitrogen fixation NifU-like protein